MHQVAVTKIYKHDGKEVRRNMHLPQNIWDSIVKQNPDKEVTWELRKVESAVKNVEGTDLIELKSKKTKVAEVEVKPEPAPEANDADFDAMLEEERLKSVAAAKEAELKAKPTKRK